MAPLPTDQMRHRGLVRGIAGPSSMMASYLRGSGHHSGVLDPDANSEHLVEPEPSDAVLGTLDATAESSCACLKSRHIPPSRLMRLRRSGNSFNRGSSWSSLAMYAPSCLSVMSSKVSEACC
mmetsp:Transcript_49921/g.116545  ORF Transcript_49921/g.116545 Transcript_49921/m.116545 type:complete len:122 (-) Transcript_49921:180-545(-)